MASTNITIRIEDDVKYQLQDLMSRLGMDLTTYFTLAAKQAIREQALPFIPKIIDNDDKAKKEEAYNAMEKIIRKGSIIDYEAELASYREEKYGK